MFIHSYFAHSFLSTMSELSDCNRDNLYVSIPKPINMAKPSNWTSLSHMTITWTEQDCSESGRELLTKGRGADLPFVPSSQQANLKNIGCIGPGGY